MYYICDLSHKVSLRLINVKTACYSCQRRKKNPFWRTENNLVLVIWGSSHISHLVILIKRHMPQLGICCPTTSKLMIVNDILHLGYLHLQICNWSSHKWGKQTGLNLDLIHLSVFSNQRWSFHPLHSYKLPLFFDETMTFYQFQYHLVTASCWQ